MFGFSYSTIFLLVLVLSSSGCRNDQGNKEANELEKALIERSYAYQRRAFSRPMHVRKAYVQFLGQELTPLIEDIRDFGREYEDLADEQKKLVDESCSGKRSLEGLPEAFLALHRKALPTVEAILHQTHSPSALGTSQMESTYIEPPEDQDPWDPIFKVDRFATCQIRLLTKENKSDKALDWCADLLALARDSGYHDNLIGWFVCVSILKHSWIPCAEALQGASKHRRHSFADQVLRIREGMVPFTRVVSEMNFIGALHAFGGLLSPRVMELLPSSLKAIAELGAEFNLRETKKLGEPVMRKAKLEDKETTWKRVFCFSRWLLWTNLRDSIALHDGMRKALTQSDLEDRDRHYHEAIKKYQSTIIGSGTEVPDFLGYDDTDRHQKSGLSMLAAAALSLNFYEKHGRWPVTSDDLKISEDLFSQLRLSTEGRSLLLNLKPTPQLIDLPAEQKEWLYIKLKAPDFVQRP